MTTTPTRFRDAEHARAWLNERLDRLEEAVRDAADIQRTASNLTADAMAQLEGEPLAFRKTAVIHLRDVEVAVTEVAADRAAREGFRIPALERLALDTIGEEPAHGRAVLEGMSAGLRDRVRHLSVLGNDGHEEAQQRTDEALIALDSGMQRVVRRWESEPLGVWNRWRRRRRLARQGLEQLAGLPDLALGLADAAREQRGALEEAWAAAVRGAVALGMARAFTEVLDWLATVLGGLDGLAHQASELARDAGHRLRERSRPSR